MVERRPHTGGPTKTGSGLSAALADRVATSVRDPATHTLAIAFAAFVVINELTRRLGRVPERHLDDPWLLLGALRARPLLAALLIGAIAMLAHLRPEVIGRRWSEIERGQALRAATGVAMAMLAWRYVTDGHDFLRDQWHAPDRILLVAAMALALARPALTVLFLIEVHLLQAPLLGTDLYAGGTEIDAAPIFVITAVAATVLTQAATGRRESWPAFTISVAAVAGALFHSGVRKLRIGWLGDNVLADLPLNGYRQGWLGDGDGGFATSMSDVIEAVEWPLMVLTLVFEIGAVIMVVNRRAAVVWLLAAVGFHLSVLAALGFLFFEFMVVELILIALAVGRSGKRWTATALRSGPMAVAVVAVGLGSLIFHSPRLAWLDGPIVYAYEIDGIDADGERWALVPADFAPYEDGFAFGELGLAPAPPLASAYGVTRSSELARLRSVESLEALAELEAEGARADREEQRARSAEVLVRFLEATPRDRGLLDQVPAAFQQFRISRTGPRYDHEQPIVRLEVEQVVTLRGADGSETVDRRPVLVIETTDAGTELSWADSETPSPGS